jgi:hypothetical protein
MIANCSMPSDICSLSLAQRSWRQIAQSELFRNIQIVTILQSQQFVNAFMCNIGPENPGKDHNHVPLENFVQNIYLDVTSGPGEDQKKSAVILRNLSTIVPIFTRIHSLYIKMSWDEIILRRDFKRFLADSIPPSLFKLSIQVLRPPISVLQALILFGSFWASISAQSLTTRWHSHTVQLWMSGTHGSGRGGT